MNKKHKEEMKVQLKRYIRTLIDKRNIRINHVFKGMIRSLNKEGSLSETQWNCLVKFMVVDFKKSPDELREILGPLVGHKYERQPLNTLEQFFEQEEVFL